MDRALLDGIELEYKTCGAGEPVVLIHAGHFADWFKPLLDESALVDHYRMLNCHPVGSAGSSHVKGPVSIADHAAHCRSLMDYLGIRCAHVVGHSSSGNVALQLALDAPAMVRSLAVLEPALFSVPSAQMPRAFIETSVRLYQSGDKAGAIDTFLTGVCGPGYRAVLDQALPGAFDQHVADADTFFGKEQPAMRQWSFTKEDARRIIQPVLAVIGAKSQEDSAIAVARQEFLLSWLPNVEPFVLPGATHLMQVQNPHGMAQRLAAFFAGHPLSRCK